MPTLISGSTGIDKVQDSSITSAKITDGAITNTDINASAAIAGSKISGSFGKVLQVVTYTNSSNDYFGTSSSSFVATNLTMSITPSATSSKILVMACTVGSTEGAGRRLCYTIYRGSTNLGQSSDGMGLLLDPDNYMRAPIIVNMLDSPSTTSATSYTLYIKNEGSSGTVECPPTTMKHHMTLIEIGA